MNKNRTSMWMRKYWLIGQAAVGLVAVRCSMRWVSLSRLLGWMSRIPVSSSKNLATVKDIAFYVDRLLKMFPANPRGNCLPRSLVMYGFSRWHGFSSQFHCGVQRVDHVLAGHAWLTVGSKPFLERGNQWEKFAVTFTFPKYSNAEWTSRKLEKTPLMSGQSNL